MVYYNPDHYDWSITTPYYDEDEEEEEDSPSIKQKNKKNEVPTSEGATLEQKKFTLKKPVIERIIERIKKRAEGQTSVTEEIEHDSNQFEDKDED